MRGQRTYNDVIKPEGLKVPLRKGRNNSLVNMRNECLVARYYYYGHFKSKNYEDILKLLVNEFFLSANTIGVIIQSNAEQIQYIKKRGAVLFYFQNHWPHFKW